MGGLGLDFGFFVFVGVGRGLYVFVGVGVEVKVGEEVRVGVMVAEGDGVAVRVTVGEGVRDGLGVRVCVPGVEVVSIMITGNDGAGSSRGPPLIRLKISPPPKARPMITIRRAAMPAAIHSRRGVFLRSACTASASRRAVSL